MHVAIFLINYGTLYEYLIHCQSEDSRIKMII